MNRPPQLVLQTAVLILHRAGYSATQVARMVGSQAAPLLQAQLTHDLLDRAGAWVRGRGITYYGARTAEDALRTTLPPRAVAQPAPGPPDAEQLDLFASG